MIINNKEIGEIIVKMIFNPQRRASSMEIEFIKTISLTTFA